MDEYIKREDAIKAITYNRLDEDGPKGLVDIVLMVAQAKIRGVSPADVAEVCRCKDCKYSREEDCDMYGCTMFRDMRKGSDFCNYGERKE